MKLRILAATLCASAAWHSASSAGLPVVSPANSSVDPCIVTCPAGDFTFHVVVRDFANVPMANSIVVVDFCSCSNVVLCPATGTDPYGRPSSCSISKLTDALGRADFPIRAGGVCSSQGGLILANGVRPPRGSGTSTASRGIRRASRSARRSRNSIWVLKLSSSSPAQR